MRAPLCKCTCTVTPDSCSPHPVCFRLTSSQKDVFLHAGLQLWQLLTLRCELPHAIRQCLEPALCHLLWGLPCRGLPTACGYRLPGPHPQLLPSGELRGHLSPNGDRQLLWLWALLGCPELLWVRCLPGWQVLLPLLFPQVHNLPSWELWALLSPTGIRWGAGPSKD